MKVIRSKIKDFLPAVVLAFTMSFMVFLHEPIAMYANNINDFWFDFYTLIGPTSTFFLCSFLMMVVVFGIVYGLAKKYKKEKIYYVALVLVSYIFIVAYINSNYLAGFLPSLDGEVIDYNELLPNLLAVAILVLVLFGIILLIKKCKLRKTIKFLTYAHLAIFAMLGVSLISTFLTTSVLEAKEFLTSSTVENLDTVSTNKNFFVFLVDAVDATHFDTVVQSKEEYKNALKDFSFFPDTVSGYAFTRDSIPFIFSGTWYTNERSFAQYSNEAFDNSQLFARLEKAGYSMNFYDNDFVWRSRKSLEFENIDAADKNVKIGTFFKQEMKYLLFKFLPHPLKRFSRIKSMNFTLAQRQTEYEPFNWSNINYYYSTLAQEFKTTDKKMFEYIHIEGGHTPFDIDEDVNPIAEEDGTYPQKLEATMKIIQKYLNRLKQAGAYDNATIVILADHGFWYEGTDRQNPILYVKAAGEKHEEMPVSERQVSYEDLAVAFVELLDGKKSQEIFANIPTDGRTRRYIYNGFKQEEHMIEYEINGKAWEADKLIKTGREFDL